MLALEAEIAVERLNIEAVTGAVLLQSAVAALLNKEAAKHWQDMVKGLLDGAT